MRSCRYTPSIRYQPGAEIRYDIINDETSQTDLHPIFSDLGPETGANGAGIAYRQHDVVVGRLLSILGNLDPALQEATKAPLDISVP
jgi:hypothetical protein